MKRTPPKMRLVLEMDDVAKPYRRTVLDPEHPLMTFTVLEETITVTVRDYLLNSKAWVGIPHK